MLKWNTTNFAESSTFFAICHIHTYNMSHHYQKIVRSWSVWRATLDRPIKGLFSISVWPQNNCKPNRILLFPIVVGITIQLIPLLVFCFRSSFVFSLHWLFHCQLLFPISDQVRLFVCCGISEDIDWTFGEIFKQDQSWEIWQAVRRLGLRFSLRWWTMKKMCEGVGFRETLNFL